ncbi:heme lyase CcmF/NrfE family subunit [Catalinimonas niigatensis]|uniref:heme lyase CcmF/NrfE family subunit n=1 Tax=Catalinimonas niigatensis TaxID=1397264 RepID=UPI002666C439|nr:cytochrome c biogenesis protein CcsA [Catalinimonas niigatensis]WPP48409.1 cytochrome c biogenesis protein CcsA [Catalinimonas niigatensis]
MFNAFLGDAGHLFVIISFITSLVAAFAYIKAANAHDLEQKQWRNYARGAFYLHGISVLGVVGTLFYIIYANHYEYHYAWSHASRSLPVYYMISSFWEGQEGSFLLWIFWHVILGVVVINTNKKWEAPVMAVFAFVQAFLASMILGVVFGDLKIGSSPFILLRDALEAPVFAANPEFVPEDGTGLNPLLQNYWMVIHPPTLFLGFALTIIPFAYCIAGLWKKDYENWVKPALPWTIFASAVLGVGIMMGAYWAYETLNFGGYWNWDPVENAVYIPWLIMIASIHTLIIFKNNGTALKTSIVLVITSFILILYSTFLTRSGILGEASVHSFTDLGLSGQLLIYLLFFTLGAIVLAAIRWKYIPTSEKEASAYSREFWIFIGVTTLCLMSFQVLVPTSIPVWNAVVELFGGISNMAPPADQIAFYTKFQLWFGVVVALLSGTGQFFFWKKMDKEKLKSELTVPVVVALLISSLAILIAKVSDPAYILLLTAAIYSVVANAKILIRFARSKNYRLAGGSVSHIGIAMILIGILFSSGYSNVVSINNSGLLLFKDAPDDANVENTLLWINEPREMGEYELTYKGSRIEVKGMPGYVNKQALIRTNDDYVAIAREDLSKDGKVYFAKGDTVKVYAENTYHEVLYTHKESGKEFSLFPRSQVNPNMGLIASPDIRHTFGKDLYTHVSAIPNDEEEKEWSELEEMEVQIGKQFFINDYVAVLENIERVEEVEGAPIEEGDLAVKANIRVYGENEEYMLSPYYLIRDRMVGRIPFTSNELGVRLTLMNIKPEENSFAVGVETTQKDYIVMKAIEKPLINVLWMGTLLLMIGFGIATTRRYKDFVKQREQEENPSTVRRDTSTKRKKTRGAVSV